MTIYFRIVFVLSSFGPLYLIIAVRLYLALGIQNPATIVATAASFCASILALMALRSLGTDEPHPFQVSNVVSKDSQIFEYIMAYIPVFLGSDIETPEFYLPVGILYIFIFLLYLRSDAPYVNPIFAALKYRIYEARTEINTIIIITNGPKPIENETINLQEVAGSEIYYCAKT